MSHRCRMHAFSCGQLSSTWALIRIGGCLGCSESLLDTQPFCWFCHNMMHIKAIKSTIR